MPTIDQHFPLIFGNGVRIPHLKTACARCHTPYTTFSMHGSVIKEDESSYVIEAAAVCTTCNSVAHFTIKACDDMSLSALMNGEWVKFMQKAQPGATPPDESSQAMPERARVSRTLHATYTLLRILWTAVYVVSVYPALMLILAGDKHNFFSFMLTNSCLCAIGYACSTVLAVRTLTPKHKKS
jgi:hypothetical protein